MVHRTAANRFLINLGQITRETLDQLTRAERDEVSAGSDQPTEGPEPESFGPRVHGDAETANQKKSPQLHGPRSADIPLEEAPEHFFDPTEWSEFVSSCGSRQDALRRISYPEPGFFVFARRQAAEQPTLVGARALEQERIAQIGQRIVADFCARLISGELEATGMAPPLPERRRPPGELWSMLVPNFEDGTAKGSGYFLTHVRVGKMSGVTPTEPATEKRIAVWIANRREQHGDELKKTLLVAIRDEFTEEVTSRAFDIAYRDIYRRKRGRPRRRR
jgi:hypothetical protein